jgi:MoxR-like ATPase
MLMNASKAMALLAGRGFVTPDDVKAMALPVLRHRILLVPEAEVEGKTTDDCINEILVAVEVPR